MKIPRELEPFETKARFLFAHRHVQEVIFSQGAYEIGVFDPADHTIYWPFLQITQEGNLQDSFCSCQDWEKSGFCPHITAAFLQIFANEDLPLHVRFEHSFWNLLFLQKATELGFNPLIKKKENSQASLEKETKEVSYLFSREAKLVIKGKTTQAHEKLKEIFENHETETQESSIKFSDFSREEILQWKRNAPSLKLAFELSFFSEIAKYLFMMQEKNVPYSITFSEEAHSLPKSVQIVCDGIEIFTSLSEKSWPLLIPSLALVKSSLSLFPWGKRLKSVTFDPQSNKLYLDIFSPTLEPLDAPVAPTPLDTDLSLSFQPSLLNSQGSQENQEKIPIDSDWIYLPQKGFVNTKKNPLFENSTIDQEKIGSFLTTHGKEIEPFLKDSKIHFDPLSLSYHLTIDPNSSLLISCYLHAQNDLDQARLFGNWLYVPLKGFYLLSSPPLFEKLRCTIPKEKIEDFIQQYRVFLSTIRGFDLHIGGLESVITYHLTSKKQLVFGAQLKVPYASEGMIDFENTIYVKDRGFYPKRPTKENSFRPGLTIPENEIGDFVCHHKEDLKQVNGFFLEDNPIESIGLSIKLTKEKRIYVSPKVVLTPPYEKVKSNFFGKTLYIENAGFFILSPADSFPEGYEKPFLVPEKEEIYFLREEVDRLQKKILFLSPALHKPKNWQLSLKKLRKKSKHRFEAMLSYHTKGGEVSVVDIWEAMRAKKEYLFSPGGLLILDDPRYGWIRKLAPSQILTRAKSLKLSSLEWLRLMALEEMVLPSKKSSESQNILSILDEISSLESISLLDVSLLKSSLRPYQERGLSWLWFLYCYGLSGLLCDEMGLGKTHQAMALISAIFSMEEKKEKKFLVVCPTSVIYHWQELLQTYLPSIQVCFYHGQFRNLDRSANLILTTYGVLRQDYKKIPIKGYELAIFDEIQFAKNPHSKTHRCLAKISSQMKLGLTGTPIENRLADLKALLDLVLPSFLPGEKAFKEQYVLPIERDQNDEVKARLQALIRPFILRRMKGKVLKELPEKIEEIAYCDLSFQQRELYNNSVHSLQGEIYSEMEQKSPSVYMHIFSLLIRLKQICDHPALFFKDPAHFTHYESGKWDLFCELFSEIRDSGQKVVIFTQYLDMIKIFESYFSSQQIGFATIKGSTIDRKGEIDRFKKDPNCEVFIGSLLAAGVGIDLSAASVVIHYDRWWNPAKENQATDRVHRFGQKRGVQVFKLVAKNTMEERIHQIIEKKSALLSEIIGTDLDQIKSLSIQELKEILGEIPPE